MVVGCLFMHRKKGLKMAKEKKQTKTLFNSTENSNFILNMMEEQYSKLATIGLMLACFSTSAFTAFAEIYKSATGRVSYSVAAGGLAVAGVFCMILALIALIRKFVSPKAVIPSAAFGLFIFWSIISLLNSYDKSVSFYGFSQRGEGLLSTLFYTSFFITAASIKRKKALKALLDGITAAGVLNAVWGIVQVFYENLGSYRMLGLHLKAKAASGLSQSPLFLATLLTLSITAAVIGAIGSDSKKRRNAYLVSAAVCSFAMMFTYSIVGVCGLVFTVIAGFISVFAVKAPKIRLLAVLAVIIPAMIPIFIVNNGTVGDINKYRFYDARSFWWADSYMRISASSDVNHETINLDDNVETYLYMTDKTVEIIKKSLVTGTGPEQLAYSQIKTLGGLSADSEISDVIVRNKNIFDKTPNEYLYITATRGIFSLLALAAVIVLAVAAGYSTLKKERDCISTSLFFVTLSGALILLICSSSIAFAPIFWSAAGAVFASKEKN